jgi:hypothetical protein
MTSNLLATRRHHRRPRPRKISSSEEIETIDLDVIPSSANTNNSVRIFIPSLEQGSVDESPLVKIIERKQRKDW